jgi:hypothetical protein
MLREAQLITTTVGTVIRTGYTAGNGNYVRSNTITPIQLNTHMSKSWFDVVNM